MQMTLKVQCERGKAAGAKSEEVATLFKGPSPADHRHPDTASVPVIRTHS